MMKKMPVFAVLVCALVGMACVSSTTAGAGSEPGTASARIGAASPAFTLEDQNGNKVSLGDYAGKVVVLEWVNPECPFVQRHYKAQTMLRLAEKYKGQGVVWLAVNSSNHLTKSDNAKWIATHSLSYPILDDHTGEVGHKYDAKTTPHMYIVDRSGNLVYNGAIDDDPRGSKGDGAVNYVEKALDEILAGKAVSVSETKPYGCTVKYAN